MKTNSLYSFGFFLVLLCIYSLNLPAQGFQKIYKMGISHAYSTIIDSNSIVIAGSTAAVSNKGIGYKDMLLMKTNLDGTVIWAKAIGGLKDDIAYRVKKTSDNGYILVGTTNSFLTNDSSNFYIVKTGRDGNIKWTKVIGRNYSEVAYDVIEKSDHTYAIVGTTHSTGNTNILFLQLDANGTLLLSKEIGGKQIESGNGIVETSDKGYLIVGSTINMEANGPVPYELPYIVKLSSTGTIEFTKTYVSNSNLTTSYRYFTKISKGYDNSYVVTGSDGRGLSPVYDAQACLVNIDSTGSVIWAKKYILNSGQGEGTSVERTLNDKYIVGGTMGQNIPALILVDKTGTRVAAKLYPGVIDQIRGRGWDAVDLQNNSIVSAASRYEGDTLVYLIKTNDHLITQTCHETNTFIDDDIPMVMTIQPQTFQIYTSPDSYISNSGFVKLLSPITYLCSTNSIEENSQIKESIALQQSASSIDFILNSGTDGIKQVCIYNLMGALLKKVDTRNPSVSTTELPAGIYIYQVTTSQQAIFNGKFIVQ